LGAAGGDSLTKPTDEGGLGWGTLGGSVALTALLIALIIYQIVQIRRHPLEPLPYPLNRLTGQPQKPNGAVVASTPPGSVARGEDGPANAPDRQVTESAERDMSP
jgi:hypothetical protein